MSRRAGKSPPSGACASACIGHRTHLDAAALVRCIEAGHPYVLALRSPIAVQWLDRGQYVFFARIDDSDTFWRIQHDLKRQRDAKGLQQA